MKKAERKAYDKAIAQYVSEINKIKPVQEIKRVDNNTKRAIEDELGSSASGRLNYLSRKADSVARVINKDDDYKSKVSRFNDRYAILKDQVAGKYTTRYGVRDNPMADPDLEPKPTGIDAYVNPPSATVDKPVNFEQTFATREEAYKAAQEKADAYNANPDNFKPRQVRAEYATTIDGLINNNSRTYTPPKITAEKLLQEVKYNGGASGRTERFNALDSGYQDMARLSNSIQSSAGNQNVSLYSSLADKLKTQYKRDSGNVTTQVKPTGLLASELAGNPLAGEVIS